MSHFRKASLRHGLSALAQLLQDGLFRPIQVSVTHIRRQFPARALQGGADSGVALLR